LSVQGPSVVLMRVCLGCGAVLSKRSRKVYCGNACQASVRRDSATKRWLESGQARIDGHQGNYIREYLADAQSGCCAICGGASAWLGLPLALVLDHIDGDPTNNRRKTCDWFARTVTRSFRHTRAGTVGTGAPTADSDMPTANRIKGVLRQSIGLTMGLIGARHGYSAKAEGCPMNGRRASAGLVKRGTDALTLLAMYPACGYPRIGPGLCAYGRAVREL
jgi:hypothetical protein